MLLTLKPPSHQHHAVPSPPHAHASPRLPQSSTISPPQTGGGALPPFPEPRGTDRMSAQHRGLPPPLALTMQDRGERPQHPPPSLAQPMGNLPAPPNQWQGADESMRNWLMAKSEEDKRKQEEEKSRQETLRLEQRRIEQDMLRESLRGGIPPPMVPLVFAGMGGSTLSNTSLEWAQHYMAQITLQQQQQQQQHPHPQQLQPPPSATHPPQPSPGLGRDRSITGPQPNPYGTQQPPAPSPSANATFQPQYHMPRNPVGPASTPTSQPRNPSALARLSTVDSQAGHMQQAPSNQQQEQSSPSIYFHHWTPPTAQKDPQTAATKSSHSSPYQQNASSHLRSEYSHSPKKRKMTTSSHSSAQPTRSPEVSPRMATETNAARRRGHSTHRSDASSRGQDQPSSRPESRHGQQTVSDAENGNSQQQSSVQPEQGLSRESTGPENKRPRSETPKREAEGPP